MARPLLGDQEIQAAISVPAPAFQLLAVSDLVPPELLHAFERAGGVLL